LQASAFALCGAGAGCGLALSVVLSVTTNPLKSPLLLLACLLPTTIRKVARGAFGFSLAMPYRSGLAVGFLLVLVVLLGLGCLLHAIKKRL